jgi:hypothetical protein
MNMQSRAIVGAALLLTTAAAFAQNPAACAAVKFSADVLERFPRAPEACFDVISRAGEEFAVFNARLDQVSGQTMRVRFRLPDGSLGPPNRITVQPDFRVLIEGKPTRVSELAPNQDLKAYVPVSRPMLALEPAESPEKLVIVPLAVDAGDRTQLAEASDSPSMPETAGPAPIFAAVGLLFGFAALGMRAVRMRASRRGRLARLKVA